MSNNPIVLNGQSISFYTNGTKVTKRVAQILEYNVVVISPEDQARWDAGFAVDSYECIPFENIL